MDWTGKYRKAFTMSYDDGVESDLHLLELVNAYGVKCTFNLNSGLGAESCWENGGFSVRRLDLPSNIAAYQGHEIAVHGTLHLAPAELDADGLRAEFAEDLDALMALTGTRPVGMAYAYRSYSDSVVEYLRSLGLQYGRTVEPSHDFAAQTDLMRFKPTCHHKDEALFDLIERFLAEESDAPQIFYLWGHAYEFDTDRNWSRLERVLDRIAGREDIFCGTNAEVLL